MQVEAATTGFLQPIIWNLLLSYLSIFKYLGCAYVGSWGLFWYNDGGEMQEACYSVGLQGAQAKYEA